MNQLCEVTENTRRGARGLTAAGEPGREPGEDTLRGTVRSSAARDLPEEVALDGGFTSARPAKHSTIMVSRRTGCSSPAASTRLQRTQRRLQKYRTGAEGRISHLKRGYGLDRSRLKGDEGQQIWNGWAILAYNADTLAVRER